MAQTVAGAQKKVLANLPKWKRCAVMSGDNAMSTQHSHQSHTQHHNIVSSISDVFLQYDNNRPDRILIFGSNVSLNILQNSENWLTDGTFLTVPPQFVQLYTVRGNKGRHVVGAYGLLPNKRSETYI